MREKLVFGVGSSQWEVGSGFWLKIVEKSFIEKSSKAENRSSVLIDELVFLEVFIPAG